MITYRWIIDCSFLQLRTKIPTLQWRLGRAFTIISIFLIFFVTHHWKPSSPSALLHQSKHLKDCSGLPSVCPVPSLNWINWYIRLRAFTNATFGPEVNWECRWYLLSLKGGDHLILAIYGQTYSGPTCTWEYTAWGWPRLNSFEELWSIIFINSVCPLLLLLQADSIEHSRPKVHSFFTHHFRTFTFSTFLYSSWVC